MKTSTNQTIGSLNALIAGLRGDPPKMTYPLAGGRHTPADLVARLTAIVHAYEAIAPALAHYLMAVRSAHALKADSRALLRDLKYALQIRASDDHEALARYGLAPRRTPGPKTPEVKLASAEKARATRAARHTMGKRQRARIKGVVEGPSVAGGGGGGLRGGGGVAQFRARSAEPPTLGFGTDMANQPCPATTRERAPPRSSPVVRPSAG
jgi:hypothetical protein